MYQNKVDDIVGIEDDNDSDDNDPDDNELLYHSTIGGNFIDNDDDIHNDDSIVNDGILTDNEITHKNEPDVNETPQKLFDAYTPEDYFLEDDICMQPRCNTLHAAARAGISRLQPSLDRSQAYGTLRITTEDRIDDDDDIQ